MIACSLFTFYIIFVVLLAPTKKIYPELLSVLEIKPIAGKDKVCVLDYSLKDTYENLPRPDWLSSWDDLMPNTFCENEYDVKVEKHLPHREVAKMLLFSLASGYYVDVWHLGVLRKRFHEDILEEMKEALWETGDILQAVLPERIHEEAGARKRLWKRTDITEFGNPAWNYHRSNLAWVSVLKDLQRSLEGRGDVQIRVKRPALCTGSVNAYGCVLWTGGSRSINSKVAAAAINSGVGPRAENERVSCRALGVFKDDEWRAGCLSNRASGCG